MSPDRERGPRRRIESAVGHELPETVWGLLESQGHARAIREAPGDSDRFFAAVGAARQFERALGYAREEQEDREQLLRRRKRRRKVGAGRPIEPGLGVAPRADALSAYFAQLARTGIYLGQYRQDDTAQFRAEFLDGKTLSRRAALQLLASPIPRYLRGEEFQRLAIPLPGHRGRVVQESTRPDDEREGVEVERVTLEVHFGGGRRPRRVLTEQPLLQRHDLALPRVGKLPATVPVWRDSVFYRLAWVAARLAHRYPWEPGDAAWFVLTGKPPQLRPISVCTEVRRRIDHNFGQVILAVSPWVKWEVVAAEYRQAVRGMTGRRSRALGLRALALFRFITGQMDEHGRLPTWEELRVRWNRAHPDWAATSEWLLSRDYRAAERIVAFPSYPGVPDDGPFARLRRVNVSRRQPARRRAVRRA